jgi:hypothetical protein
LPFYPAATVPITALRNEFTGATAAGAAPIRSTGKLGILPGRPGHDFVIAAGQTRDDMSVRIAI